MNSSCADALLAYAMRAVEAKRTVEEEAAEFERAHDSLLVERLEKEREWLEELERHAALLDYKADKKRNITKFKTTVVIRRFTQIRNLD